VSVVEQADDHYAFFGNWPRSLVLRFARLPIGAEFTVRDLRPRPDGVESLTHFVQDAIAQGRVLVVGKQPFRSRRAQMRRGVRVSGQIWLRVLKRVV
jgi:hypothetical protein